MDGGCEQRLLLLTQGLHSDPATQPALERSGGYAVAGVASALLERINADWLAASAATIATPLNDTHSGAPLNHSLNGTVSPATAAEEARERTAAVEALVAALRAYPEAAARAELTVC